MDLPGVRPPNPSIDGHLPVTTTRAISKSPSTTTS